MSVPKSVPKTELMPIRNELKLNEFTKTPKFTLASKMNNIQFEGMKKAGYIGTKTIGLLVATIADLAIFAKNATYGNTKAYFQNRTLTKRNIEIAEYNIEAEKYNIEAEKYNIEAEKHNIEAEKHNIEAENHIEENPAKSKSRLPSRTTFIRYAILGTAVIGLGALGLALGWELGLAYKTYALETEVSNLLADTGSRRAMSFHKV